MVCLKKICIHRNDQTDTDTLYIDDSDTLSNRSSENTEQEQQDFDQRWAIANGELSTPLVNYDTFNTLDEVNRY